MCVLEDQKIMIIIRIDVCQIISKMMLSSRIITLGINILLVSQCIFVRFIIGIGLSQFEMKTILHNTLKFSFLCKN